MIPFHLHRGNREKAQEMKSGYKMSKSVPSDIFSSANFHLLNALEPSEAAHKQGTKCSNTCSYGEHLFKPSHLTSSINDKSDSGTF